MRIECDRCKKVYDQYRDTTIDRNWQRIGVSQEYHICPDCGDIILGFIQHPKDAEISEEIIRKSCDERWLGKMPEIIESFLMNLWSVGGFPIDISLWKINLQSLFNERYSGLINEGK